jgi:tetratricopeptide (TPR) repeat protein
VKKIIISLLLIIVPFGLSWGNLKHQNESLRTRVFFTQTDELGKDVVLKGVILSISASEKLPDNDIFGISREKTKATIRLYSKESVKLNDSLYVIDSNNLVVSKMEVKHLFSNNTFGTMALGYGNLKLSSEGYRVVQILKDHNAQWAFLHKSRGDLHARNNNNGMAISEYKKAIEMDSGNPEARMALGIIYYKDGIYNFAYSELKKAYDNIQRLYDNEDKFILLSTLAEVSFIEAYKNYNVHANRERFRKEGIIYCHEALKVNDRSPEINFLLGEFYYKSFKSSDEIDKKARDSFLKTIAVNPDHSMANLRLAILYFKYSNREKGLFYAKKALESDPDNSEARELLQRYN